jgi:hypothetical protein
MIRGGTRMSIENVKKFYRAIDQDKQLNQKFAEISGKHTAKAIDTANASLLLEQAVLTLAAQEGFHFTPDDLRRWTASENSLEVCDEDLEAVAGGSSDNDYVYVPQTIK